VRSVCLSSRKKLVERTQWQKGKKKIFFTFLNVLRFVRAKEEEKDYGIRPKNIVAMQDWN
jgi:hypothetical protein